MKFIKTRSGNPWQGYMDPNFGSQNRRTHEPRIPGDISIYLCILYQYNHEILCMCYQ